MRNWEQSRSLDLLAGAPGIVGKRNCIFSKCHFLQGIAILIQVIGIGNWQDPNIPLFALPSVTPLSPMILIEKEYGMQTLFGAVIASGAIIFILSFYGSDFKTFPC